jgi:SAM-dependent methyltransferase
MQNAGSWIVSKTAGRCLNKKTKGEKDMSNDKEIRERVSKDYARAVTTQADGGSACCGGTPAQKGVVAKLAGYTDAELAALPPEAVVNSFGCGNPLAFSSVKEGQTVLDLGSGAGIDLLLAARKVGPTGRVIGIDMTDEMIAKANENIAASKLQNVEVRKGIIEELPVDTASVDWVISNCVINLSPEKPRVFREIARVLKSGGTMMVSDIVAENLPTEVLKSPILHSSCVAGALSEKDYIAGLEAAGLIEVEVLNRLVYDSDQLESFIGSELSELKESSGCCGSSAKGGEWAKKMASDLAGKIWSVKVKARKS